MVIVDNDEPTCACEVSDLMVTGLVLESSTP